MVRLNTRIDEAEKDSALEQENTALRLALAFNTLKRQANANGFKFAENKFEPKTKQ